MMQHELTRNLGIKYEPSLKMKLIPGFACCGIPNPKALAYCPSCGAAAAPAREYEADEVVMTFPWLARVMFKIGEWLLNLAKKIEGDR